MQIKSTLLILILSGVIISACAQVSLSGNILDSAGRIALPYVNIGIKGKNVGTVSKSDGSFTLNIPAQNIQDTLTFSMVGYEELKVPVISAVVMKLYWLKQKTEQMNPVTVSTSRLSERPFGITNSSKLIHITDGSTNQDDIFEIAQLIKLDTAPSRITSLNLLVSQNRVDSGTFRINFYGFDGNRPTERILEKSIIQKKQIREGWLKFDLRGYDIYLQGNFVVALEFIPSGKKNNPIFYEVKIGGAARSFVRSNSQGEWGVPPHHYRMYLTALVPDNSRKNSDDADKETPPTTQLYSSFVKDTFSLFVHLPSQYSKKKNQRYPVIYLLDANVYFDLVAREMESQNVNAILVGIGYKDFISMDSLRNRDYLYPEALRVEGMKVYGGANSFLKFISSELMPWLNKSYATDTLHQTLMGHSFGGYFVLYAMLQAMQDRKQLFTDYVAASPSLEYSNKYLLRQYQLAADTSGMTKNLFITYGGKEDSEDGGTGSQGLDSFNFLVDLLADKKYSAVHLTSQVYPTFGHMETAMPTFFGAIHTIK